MLTDITHMSEMSLLTIETMDMAKSDPGIMCWFRYQFIRFFGRNASESCLSGRDEEKKTNAMMNQGPGVWCGRNGPEPKHSTRKQCLHHYSIWQLGSLCFCSWPEAWVSLIRLRRQVCPCCPDQVWTQSWGRVNRIEDHVWCMGWDCKPYSIRSLR